MDLPDKYFFQRGPSTPDAPGGGKARARVDLMHLHPFKSEKSGLLNEETADDWVNELGGHEGVS